jgi:hypothetical protein
MKPNQRNSFFLPNTNSPQSTKENNTTFSLNNLKTHIKLIIAQKLDKHNVMFQMDINKSSFEFNSLSVFKNTTLLWNSHLSKYSFPIKTTQDDPIQWAKTFNNGTILCHLNRTKIPRDFHPFLDSWSPTFIPTPKDICQNIYVQWKVHSFCYMFNTT